MPIPTDEKEKDRIIKEVETIIKLKMEAKQRMDKLINNEMDELINNKEV